MPAGAQQRVAPGLNGGMVLLGQRTRNYGVKRFAEFITFIQSVAADRGVRLGDEPMQDVRDMEVGDEAEIGE